MPTSARSVRVNAQLLRQLRTGQGLTQRELAKRAGYSERLIRKAENGGSLTMETIINLAQSLSTPQREILPQQLVLDILAIAKEWLAAFDTIGQGMVPFIRHHLAPDFVFVCPGKPEVAPFIGIWPGVEGLQQWLDHFFSVFRRLPLTDTSYTVGEYTVNVRFLESGYIGDQLCGPVRINMHFQFNDDGLICRIDDDYDTQAGAETKAAAEQKLSSQL